MMPKPDGHGLNAGNIERCGRGDAGSAFRDVLVTVLPVRIGKQYGDNLL